MVEIHRKQTAFRAGDLITHYSRFPGVMTGIPNKQPVFRYNDMRFFKHTCKSSRLIVSGALHTIVCFFRFFVAGGNRNNNGSLNNVGSNGNYWSSSVSGSNARNLNFNSSNANMNSNNRVNGRSVRCTRYSGSV